MQGYTSIISRCSVPPTWCCFCLAAGNRPGGRGADPPIPRDAPHSLVVMRVVCSTGQCVVEWSFKFSFCGVFLFVYLLSVTVYGDCYGAVNYMRAAFFVLSSTQEWRGSERHHWDCLALRRRVPGHLVCRWSSLR
ncbi:unnamed protein product [Discosporangium mesarthrocarpum]